MLLPLLVWLGSALVVFALLVGLRRLSLKRAGRMSDFHWRGMAVLAIALGALPAIFLAAVPGPRVPIPDNVAVSPLSKQPTPK
jgi:hypothetical protein